jgi:hypothetical protein
MLIARYLPSVLCTLGLVGAIACSSPTPATPVGVLDISLSQTSRSCPDASGIWLRIGEFTTPTKVRDQEIYKNQTATINCKVLQLPDGKFDVSALARLDGNNGQFGLTGTVSAKGPSKVSATFAKLGVALSQNDCELTIDELKTEASPNTPQPLIVPGAMRGKITCTNAATTGDGAERACKAQVSFLFENCDKGAPVD